MRRKALRGFFKRGGGIASARRVRVDSMAANRVWRPPVFAGEGLPVDRKIDPTPVRARAIVLAAMSASMNKTRKRKPHGSTSHQQFVRAKQSDKPLHPALAKYRKGIRVLVRMPPKPAAKTKAREPRADSSKSDAFGAFEQHTKGVGSRILSKYGFEGRLGKHGTGIRNPVRPATSFQHTQKRRRTQPSSSDTDTTPKLSPAPRSMPVSTPAPYTPGEANITPAELKTLESPHYRAVIIHFSALCTTATDLNRRAWHRALCEYFDLNDALVGIMDKCLARAQFSPFVTDESALRIYAAQIDGIFRERNINAQSLLAADSSEIIARKDEIYRSLLRDQPHPPIEAIRALIGRLRADRWLVAVVHPGSRARANADLKNMGIKFMINTSVNASSLPRGCHAPYTPLLEEVLARLATNKDKAVVVATCPYEAIGAQAVGVECLFLPNSEWNPIAHDGKSRGRVLHARDIGFTGGVAPELNHSTLDKAILNRLAGTRSRIKSKQAVLKKGDRCLALFTADGLLYPARIRSSYNGKDPVLVEYDSYGNSEQLQLDRILLLRNFT